MNEYELEAQEEAEYDARVEAEYDAIMLRLTDLFQEMLIIRHEHPEFLPEIRGTAQYLVETLAE